MTNGLPTPEMPKISPEMIPGEDLSDIEADQQAYERSAERLDDVLHAEQAGSSPVRIAKDGDDEVVAQPRVAISPKDPVVIEVEKILEDGIGPFYAAMPQEAKDEFKKKGEAVAQEVSDMVRTFHVRFRRLISLITSWLKTIPGVNKYFLEQEAKIKADRIVQLIEARKNDMTHSV
ncbi:MAG: hypothetical protein KIH65_004345 [Candidatus Uhrbacteria bacterium]|nr:hypothetical protein [Candidatus Uhrbacteria bacterium]